MKKVKKMNIEYRLTNNEFRNLDYPEFPISNFKNAINYKFINYKKINT